jgi:SAM-dependent methyltransferase
LRDSDAKSKIVVAAHVVSSDDRAREEASAMSFDRAVIDAQRNHWERVFAENVDMYGTDPSAPGRFALDSFERASSRDILELGAGQGRDTLAFLAAGYRVTALDYAEDALRSLTETAEQQGIGNRLTTIAHDVRRPLPLADLSMDAVYSHMLFSMALSTSELDGLGREVHRVLRPGGLNIYTVRHIGDAHYGSGISHGDGIFESGGFIVHFFDERLVDRLAAGFDIVDRAEFEEGELPRKLWRITMRKQ